MKTYITGTLQLEMKHTPHDLKDVKFFFKGETIARHAEGVMIGRWKNKRVVSYITMEFDNDMVTIIINKKV